MADCAAAPSLFYADWVHEIGREIPTTAELSFVPVGEAVVRPRR